MTATLHALKPVDSPLRSELATMRLIADALEHLPNDDARARVLQCVAEFYRVGRPSQSMDDARAARARDSHAGLSVDELASMLQPRPVPATPAEEFGGAILEPEPKPETPPTRSVTSMISSFVADFQRLARAWQG